MLQSSFIREAFFCCRLPSRRRRRQNNGKRNGQCHRNKSQTCSESTITTTRHLVTEDNDNINSSAESSQSDYGSEKVGPDDIIRNSPIRRENKTPLCLRRNDRHHHDHRHEPDDYVLHNQHDQLTRKYAIFFILLSSTCLLKHYH